MPFRLGEGRTKIQFVSFAAMPALIHQACLKTGVVSGTRYIQIAVCAALARDLGLTTQELTDQLPPTRGPAGHLAHPDDNPFARPGNRNATGVGGVGGGTWRIGPGNTIEEVR